MAVPTKAEYWTQIATAADIIEGIYNNGIADINTKHDTLQQLSEGNNLLRIETSLSIQRAMISGGVDEGKRLLEGYILDMARTQYNSKHGGDVVRALQDVRLEMAAASETIKYRNITRDTIAYGGPNVGTGIGYRCYTDKYGDAMEAGYAAQKTTIDCFSDKNTGASASGREQFRIWGEGRSPRDNLDIGTATDSEGILTAIRSIDCKLGNASFEEGTGEAATTSAITNWTATSGTFNTDILRTAAAAAADSDGAPFRNKPGQTTGRCLQLTAGTSKLTQKFSVRKIRANPNLPLLAVARIRPSTGTAFQGTFEYRVGSKTSTLVHGSMSAGWNDKEILTFNSSDAWYDNFREDDVRVEVGLSAWTQGSLYVDEIILCQPGDGANGIFFDGVYYAVLAGATDWQRGLSSVTDTMDWTDTSADTGEMQYWIQRLFGIYLPHTSGAPTYADV
jgi:hypothetical protein